MPDITTYPSVRTGAGQACAYCDRTDGLVTMNMNGHDTLLCEHCREWTLECINCGTHMARGTTDVFYIAEGAVCRECFRDVVVSCEECGHSELREGSSMHEHNGITYCGTCWERRERERIRREQREERRRQRYAGGAGSILTSDRYFGIELEAENGYGSDVDIVDDWFATNDGSLDDGTEYVSPPMRGEGAENDIYEMCDAISNAEFEATPNCGYHIHVGTPNITDQQVKRILYGYIAFEALFVGMIPKSRRTGTWCKPLHSLVSEYVDSNELNLRNDNVIYNPNPNLRPTLMHYKLAEMATNGEIPKEKIDAYCRRNILYRDRVGFGVVRKDVDYSSIEGVKVFAEKYRGNFWDALQVYQQYMRLNRKSFKVMKQSAQDLVRNPKAMSVPIDKIEKWWYSAKEPQTLSLTKANVLSKRGVQTRKTGGKYDNSRYAGLNLHIMFQEREQDPANARFEIRYHPGTLNPKKVLMWAEIHTKFADALLEKPRLSQRYFEKVLDLPLDKKMQAFQRLTGVTDEVMAYMETRISKFNR